MKHLILTLLLGCTGLLTFSQTNNWAPVGAKWWYTTYPVIGPPGYVTYGLLEVQKDTTIDMLSCSKMLWQSSPNSIKQVFYIYETDSFVYSVNPISNDSIFICKLYEKYVNVGDTVSINCNTDKELGRNIELKIDSIVNTNIGGTHFSVRHTTQIKPLPSDNFDGTVIEKLGHTRYLFFTNSLGSSHIPTELRCYEYNNNSYNIGSYPSCDFTGVLSASTPVDLSDKMRMTYLPSGDIYIAFEMRIVGYRLFDASGRLIRTEKPFNKNSIQLTKQDFSSGYYIVTIESEKGYSYNFKVML